MAEAPKKRTFRKFSYRGVDLEQLLDMKTEALVDLFRARIRRRFKRGLTRKPMKLVKKLRKAKKEVVGGEKPEAVRTHLRNMVIVPEVRLASPAPPEDETNDAARVSDVPRSPRPLTLDPPLTTLFPRSTPPLSPLSSQMIGSVVGVYNGKVFNNVEIKPDMVGTYLGEYSITYRPVAHGRGGQAGGKFVPLK